VSRFKAGDRVRCVSATGSMSVGEIDTVFNADPHDGTMQLSKNGGWWFRQSAFELVPQPVESPDDWVTQDVVRARPGIDERAYRYDTTPEEGLQWDGAESMKWDPMPMHGERGNGVTVHLRCRRRDYPQKPAEVHSGGPYVARSEYERVLAESAAKDKAIAELAEHIRQLDRMIHEPTPNGWPLVPVDPSCIPEGHRAVEVTKNTQGKFVASHSVHRFLEDHNYPRLVVEPIPTPQSPDALPRPEFPVWIRAGWWVAMDTGGFWYMSKDEPFATEPVLGSTAGRGTWNPPNMDDIQLTHGVTASMKAVPCDRWREAKWQVE